MRVVATVLAFLVLMYEAAAREVVKRLEFGDRIEMLGRVTTSSDEYNIAPTALLVLRDRLFILDRAKHRVVSVSTNSDSVRSELEYGANQDFFDAFSDGERILLFHPLESKASIAKLDGDRLEFEQSGLQEEETRRIFYAKQGTRLTSGSGVPVVESEGACNFTGVLSVMDGLFLTSKDAHDYRFLDCDCVGTCNPAYPEFQGELVLRTGGGTGTAKVFPVFGGKDVNRVVPLATLDGGWVAVRVDSSVSTGGTLRAISWLALYSGTTDAEIAYTEPVAASDEYALDSIAISGEGQPYVFLVGDDDARVERLEKLPDGEFPWTEETTVRPTNLEASPTDPLRDLGLTLTEEVDPGKEYLTRAEITACALSFAAFRYIPSEAIFGDGGQCAPENGDWQERPYGMTVGVEEIGMPYSWGGGDGRTEGAEAVVSQLRLAGNICARRDCRECVQPDRTFGVDCSGLVSNCWRLGRKVGTHEIPSYGEIIEFNELRPGDVLNRAGKHVYIFIGRRQTASGEMISVVDASVSIGRVAVRDLPVSAFDGYTPLRRKKLEQY